MYHRRKNARCTELLSDFRWTFRKEVEWIRYNFSDESLYLSSSGESFTSLDEAFWALECDLWHIHQLPYHRYTYFIIRTEVRFLDCFLFGRNSATTLATTGRLCIVNGYLKEGPLSEIFLFPWRKIKNQSQQLTLLFCYCVAFPLMIRQIGRSSQCCSHAFAFQLRLEPRSCNMRSFLRSTTLGSYW